MKSRHPFWKRISHGYPSISFPSVYYACYDAKNSLPSLLQRWLQQIFKYDSRKQNITFFNHSNDHRVNQSNNNVCYYLLHQNEFLSFLVWNFGLPKHFLDNIYLTQELRTTIVKMGLIPYFREEYGGICAIWPYTFKKIEYKMLLYIFKTKSSIVGISQDSKSAMNWTTLKAMVSCPSI